MRRCVKLAASACHIWLQGGPHHKLLDFVQAGTGPCLVVSVGEGGWQATVICQLPSRCHLHSLIQEAACRVQR